MLQLTINEKGGPTRTESFDKDEVTIGRVQGNDIILPKGNISKRHSRIVLKEGKFVIVDLKSTNGTYVNGKKITAPQVIKSSDKVYIGDFTIQINHGNGVEERARSLAGAEEEIDLFGGEAAFEAEAGPANTPGLIDENFDQEFEAPATADAKARLPKPSKRPRRAEPEPELELDDDFGPSEAGAEPPPLDLDAGFEEEDPAPPEAEGPPPELEPAPEALVPLSEPEEEEEIEGPEPAIAEQEPEVAPDLEVTPPPEVSALPLTDRAPTSMPAPAEVSPVVAPAVSMVPPEAPLDREEILAELQLAIRDGLGLAGRPLEEVPTLSGEAADIATARLQTIAPRLLTGDRANDLVSTAVLRTTGIGPLVELLVDDSVFEVVVTPERQVFVDREGRLEPAGHALANEVEMISAIHSLALLAGLDPFDVGPIVDVRLRSGARVLATMPPVAFRGPSLTVRKTTRDFFTLDKLQEYDTINDKLLAFLDAAVRFRKSVLLSIGPGVSATATLNALLAQVPSDERVVTVERRVELHLRGHANAVGFDLQDELEMQDVLRFAASAQTERVFLGELTEADAVSVVESFGSTIEGGAAAVVAPSAQEAAERLVGWVADHRPGGIESAWRAVARAFPIVLQEHKLSDNSRRVTQVCEIVVEEEGVRVEEIFRFEPKGVDENMMIEGSFVPCGRVPEFLQALAKRGEVEIDPTAYMA